MLLNYIIAKGVRSITAKLLSEAVLIKPIMDDLGTSKELGYLGTLLEQAKRRGRGDQT